MAWNDILGQVRVKQLLQRFFESNRIPHALLFYGPEGVGKEAVAIEFARVLNCEQGSWNACGQCKSCIQFRTLHHPRLKLVFPLPSHDESKDDSALDNLKDAELQELHVQMDEKARNPYHRISIPNAQGIKISSIRDIQHEAGFRAAESGRTVFVLCEADRMNVNAANALLKTLEEPSGGVLLILTTAKKDSLLPTILSRCQQVRFDPLTETEILAGLDAVPEISHTHTADAAYFATGNFSLALELAKQSDFSGLLKPFEVVEFLRTVVTYNPPKLLNKIQGYVKKDQKRQLQIFLLALGSWFRDVLAVQEGVPSSITNEKMRDSLEKFAAHYPDLRCAEAIETIESAIDMIKKNVHLTCVLIVLAQRLRILIKQS
jgi:DNA polymerase III subunit delta'